MENMILKCVTHPRYSGKSCPKNNCIICWKIRVYHLNAQIKALKKGMRNAKFR